MPRLAAIREATLVLFFSLMIVIGLWFLYVIHPAFAVAALSISIGMLIVYYTMKGVL